MVDSASFQREVAGLLNCKPVLLNLEILKSSLVAYLREYLHHKEIRRALIAFDLIAKQEGTYLDSVIKLKFRTIDSALRLVGRAMSPWFLAQWT